MTLDGKPTDTYDDGYSQGLYEGRKEGKAEREKLIGALEEIKENNKVNCPCFGIADAVLAEIKEQG